MSELKYRIGRDFFQTYTITDKSGKAINLSEVENLKVTIVREASLEKTEQTFALKDVNVVAIQWCSTENTKLGVYRTVIEWDAKNSGSETGYIHSIVDFNPAFEIVNYSTEESTSDETLTGTVNDYGKDGLSAFEVWKATYGTQASTITDYMAYLQKPATVTDTSFKNGELTLKIGE